MQALWPQVAMELIMWFLLFLFLRDFVMFVFKG